MNWETQIGKRCVFVGTFASENGAQMLLNDVCREDGVLFRDHVYIPYTTRFRKLALKSGDRVRLVGKVNRYWKRAPGQEGIPAPLVERIPMLGITNICEVQRC